MRDLFYKSAIFLIFLLPGVGMSLGDDSEFNSIIVQSKSQEASKIAPYQNEVQEIKKQSYEKIQFPAIQNEIQSIKQNNAAPLQKLTGSEERQVYIFVSSSMSNTSLQQWFNQANKLHIPLILRGVVGGTLMNTKMWVKQFVENNKGKGGFEIDPPLFEKYNIQNVPAVVISDASQKSCPSNESCMPSNYDVVYGNVNLKTSLKAIAEYGDAGKNTANHFLHILQKINEEEQQDSLTTRKGSFYES